MRVNYILCYLGRITIAVLLLLNLLGCSRQTESPNQVIGNDSSQLPVFIRGEWLSTEVRSDKSEPINLQYKIVFETESKVKFIVIYPDSSTEGYTFTYRFVDQNSIYIENKRITGGETWLLTKQEDELIVTRNFDNKSTTIILERTK